MAARNKKYNCLWFGKVPGLFFNSNRIVKVSVAPGKYRRLAQRGKVGCQMTPGQIAKLQELSKCYMVRRSDKNFVKAWWFYVDETDRMTKWDKDWLRGLMHQYRHQISAMARNRK